MSLKVSGMSSGPLMGMIACDVSTGTSSTSNNNGLVFKVSVPPFSFFIKKWNGGNAMKAAVERGNGQLANDATALVVGQ